MGEEAFDEVVLAATDCTVYLRGGYGRDEMWLGLAEGNTPDDGPDMILPITPRQQAGIAEALEELQCAALAQAHDDIEVLKKLIADMAEYIDSAAPDGLWWAESLSKRVDMVI